MRSCTARRSQITLSSGSLSSCGESVRTSCFNPSRTQRHSKSKNAASTCRDSALLSRQVSPKKKRQFCQKKMIKQGSAAGAASHRYSTERPAVRVSVCVASKNIPHEIQKPESWCFPSLPKFCTSLTRHGHVSPSQHFQRALPHGCIGLAPQSCF